MHTFKKSSSVQRHKVVQNINQKDRSLSNSDQKDRSLSNSDHNMWCVPEPSICDMPRATQGKGTGSQDFRRPPIIHVSHLESCEVLRLITLICTLLLCKNVLCMEKAFHLRGQVRCITHYHIL